MQPAVPAPSAGHYHRSPAYRSCRWQKACAPVLCAHCRFRRRSLRHPPGEAPPVQARKVRFEADPSPSLPERLARRAVCAVDRASSSLRSKPARNPALPPSNRRHSARRAYLPAFHRRVRSPAMPKRREWCHPPFQPPVSHAATPKEASSPAYGFLPARQVLLRSRPWDSETACAWRRRARRPLRSKRRIDQARPGSALKSRSVRIPEYPQAASFRKSLSKR